MTAAAAETKSLSLKAADLRLPALVCLGGLIVSLLAYWPGAVGSDAVDQFKQAMARQFTDWHPPIMGLVWSLLVRIVPGALPMLLLQVAFYWSAAFLMLLSLPRDLDRRVRWVATFAVASPVVLNFVGFISKDAQLATTWAFVAATSYFIRFRGREPGLALRLVLLVLILYGALLRQNATIVAGPLVLYVMTGRGVLKSFWRTIGAWLGIAILCLGLGAGLNKALHVQHSLVLRSLIMFDMAGTSVATGTSQFPFPVSAAELDQIGKCYNRGFAQDPYIWGDCSFVFARDKALGGSDLPIIADWLRMIAEHPAAYLLHRFRHYGLFLGLRTLRPTWGIFIEHDYVNANGFNFHPGPLFKVLKAYAYATAVTPFSRVAFWLVAAAGLMLLTRRASGPARDFALALGALSFLYLLTYLPFGVAPFFRYAYPAVILTIFGYCAMATEAADWIADLWHALAGKAMPRRRLAA